MTERAIDYECEGAVHKATVVLPAVSGKVPGVLVAHDWGGKNDFAVGVARRIASLGYVGFALDMYGEGKTATTVPDKVALMSPVKENRALLIKRVNAALAALKAQPEVDTARTGAIGFCFGGLCVLDLARSGAAVGGVVSFHGLLDAPPAELCHPVKAKVLVLHGYKDPMGPPEQMMAFCKEMDAAGIDWQLHAYGTALHAFANPEANDQKLGTVHEERAADRAFRSMTDFFGDLF